MTLRSGVDLALDKILNEPNQFEVRQTPIPAPRKKLLERLQPTPTVFPKIPPVKTPLLQRQERQALETKIKGIPQPKPPEMTFPSGFKMTMPENIVQMEKARMTNPERVAYESDPQKWYEERDKWRSNRVGMAREKDILEMAGFTTEENPEADIQNFLSLLLWTIPIPLGKGANALFQAAKKLLPAGKQATISAVEQTVRKIAQTEIKFGTKKPIEEAIVKAPSEIPKAGKIIPKKITPALEVTIPEGVRPNLYVADIEGMMPDTAKIVKTVRLSDGSNLVLKSDDGDIYGLINNRAVGFATKLSDTETDLSVAMEFRNKGIGTELMRQFRGENPTHQLGGLTEGGRAVISKLETPVTPEDKVLNEFGKKIASPKTTEEFAQQKELWAVERATRAGKFNQILESELAKGTGAEESIKKATNAFGGEYPRTLTGLGLPDEFKDAAYGKIIRVIQADTEIPEAIKSLEISATTKALDNALAGKPIPNIPGIKGGSAKTRLLKVFQDNPIIREIIENPEEIQRRLLENARPPVNLNPNLLDQLEGLSPLGKQLKLLPVPKRTRILGVLKRVGINAVDALGIPKSLKFGFDVSMPLRQGAIMGARHPISWVKMWKPMLQALRSEEIALKLNNEMLTDPEIMRVIDKMGLDLYGVEKRLGYMARPESMASLIAEKYIPGVRQSARSAAVAMNKIMTDVGVKNYRIMQKMGASEEEYKAMGALINQLSGRGTLKPVIKPDVADVLNKLLTSPRYLVSRFQWPTKLLSESKAVRQEAASTLVAWAGLCTSIIGMAYASGVRVEFDPRSADAYKIRIGNKRIDIWVGYAQIIRLLAQLATGQRKTTTGEIISIPRSQVLARYAQSKESPGIGALVTLASGTNYVGEKIDLKTLEGIGKTVKETFMPAALEEMLDAYVLEGMPSAGLSGLGLAGVGVSTYEAGAKTPTPIPPSGKPRISGQGKIKSNLKFKTQK